MGRATTFVKLRKIMVWCGEVFTPDRVMVWGKLGNQ